MCTGTVPDRAPPGRSDPEEWQMMSRQGIWLAGIAITSCLYGVSAMAEEPRPRTVNVSGMAEVSAEPDIARLTLGVESRKPTMEAARAEVVATVDRVLALARELKIDPKQVNATRVQVQPEYRWNENDRERVLLGYMVSRQVEVELKDLDKLGTLLERAVDAGVNHVGDPLLDSSRRKELEREAMTKAVEDARLNAEALARAAGAKLGAVRTLSASGSAPPMPMYRQTMMAADAKMAPEATYQPGDMKFGANVNAEYDLVTGP
jgi:uncharacterized protein YggE